MFIVQEIQTSTTTALTPALVYETRKEAESAFYTICGSAVISSVPKHTVMVFTEEGFVIPELCKCFIHEETPSEAE